MQIAYFAVGKTTSAAVRQLTDEYFGRIQRYARFEEIVIDNTTVKATDAEAVKAMEGDLLLKKILPQDYVVLLDERGKEYSSEEFAVYLQKLFNRSPRRLCFVTGGAYGFSEAVYARADGMLRLSKMTLAHQLVRAVFAEQLYRAFTIIHHEPYHHR
ncbi:MAG: 23S rRNA (pseudouridine(1915)-N(3))-methyltransferase RlmH [Chitinophagales bacterium]|nr:23S rRNA (pseudouridine(1915)-N(3))-methyltransferase RlmH [Chitinophagales bacterium]MDW8419807.1 23S rRNA (pseudouridine(1915)-N(3))-methyltransferase RlmH [Chitinophagales bacterium]